MSPSMRSETSSSPSSSSSRKVSSRDIVAHVDILVDRHVLVGLARLNLLERHHLGPGRLKFGLVLLGRPRDHGSGGATAERNGLEHGAAFRANSRILVEVVEFRAAAHALALQAEFRFGHGDCLQREEIESAPVSRGGWPCQMGNDPARPALSRAADDAAESLVIRAAGIGKNEGHKCRTEAAIRHLSRPRPGTL